MLDYLGRFILPAAFDVLPAEMASPQAAAMLLAIALQESRCSARRQGGDGPARGFWQFEAGGIRGVLRHPDSMTPARALLPALCYPPTIDAMGIRNAIEHNDVLACAFARLLLWTLPGRLPERQMADIAWMQYLQAWRPGKPRAATWKGNFERAWSIAAREQKEDPQ